MTSNPNPTFQHVLIPVPLDELLKKMATLMDERILAAREKELMEKLLNQTEARKLFRPLISRQTFYRIVKEGKIPKYKIGAGIYYKYSDIMNAAQEIKLYKK
jgi:Helix-turn-helix domain